MSGRTVPAWRRKAEEAEARAERNLARQTVAFRIEVLRENYYLPILISRNGGEERASTCVCAVQAAFTATRGGSRPLEYRGMSGYLEHLGHSTSISSADLHPCTVTDPAHTHVHHIGIELP